MQETERPTQEMLEDEIATLVAHVNAATARWLELVRELERGGGAVDGVERWLAFRCGITTREAQEYVRVGEALDELPTIRDAFARGQLSFTKVRALSRVATSATEGRLLELAFSLTASQLDRALRAFRRLQLEEARESHELEYVDYYWADDGSLILRARLCSEDGVLLVQALEACRERVREQRRQERAEHSDDLEYGATDFELPRSPQVEALVELSRSSVPLEEGAPPQLVVHVDAHALLGDDAGRSELERGPTISPETARRLSCDAETLSVIERDGLSLSVGRRRRTVPPKLRRVLEARDDHECRFPGCENRRYLDAHHRTHWAHGGETSLENLVLLCSHHHRLVHEGGYTIEEGDDGQLRFRNRHGVLCPTMSRPPPGSVARLIAGNGELEITPRTNRNGDGDPMDLGLVVDALLAPA
jgi:hypothetical protein